jgi:hypothetical protein
VRTSGLQPGSGLQTQSYVAWSAPKLGAVDVAHCDAQTRTTVAGPKCPGTAPEPELGAAWRAPLRRRTLAFWLRQSRKSAHMAMGPGWVALGATALQTPHWQPP